MTSCSSAGGTTRRPTSTSKSPVPRPRRSRSGPIPGRRRSSTAASPSSARRATTTGSSSTPTRGSTAQPRPIRRRARSTGTSGPRTGGSGWSRTRTTGPSARTTRSTRTSGPSTTSGRGSSGRRVTSASTSAWSAGSSRRRWASLSRRASTRARPRCSCSPTARCWTSSRARRTSSSRGCTSGTRTTPSRFRGGAHHITIKDCVAKGGRYHVHVRDGAHDVTLDGLQVQDAIPPWVARTDVKQPSDGRPAHLLQGAGIGLEGATDSVLIQNCTIAHVFDAIYAPDTPTNLRILHNTFECVRDDVVQCGTGGWNVEFGAQPRDSRPQRILAQWLHAPALGQGGHEVDPPQRVRHQRAAAHRAPRSAAASAPQVPGAAGRRHGRGDRVRPAQHRSRDRGPVEDLPQHDRRDGRHEQPGDRVLLLDE